MERQRPKVKAYSRPVTGEQSQGFPTSGYFLQIRWNQQKEIPEVSLPPSTMKKPDPPRAAKFKWVKGAAAAVARVVSSSGKFPALERPLCVSEVANEQASKSTKRNVEKTPVYHTKPDDTMDGNY